MGMDWKITVLIGLPFDEFGENQREEINDLREKHYGDLPDGLVYVNGGEASYEGIYVGYPLIKRYMGGDDAQKSDIGNFIDNISWYKKEFYIRFGLEPVVLLVGDYI